MLTHALANSTSAVETLLIMNSITLLRDYHGYAFELSPKTLGNAFSEISSRLEHLHPLDVRQRSGCGESSPKPKQYLSRQIHGAKSVVSSRFTQSLIIQFSVQSPGS